jgi:hypothetical protein
MAIPSAKMSAHPLQRPTVWRVPDKMMTYPKPDPSSRSVSRDYAITLVTTVKMVLGHIPELFSWKFRKNA